MSCRSGHKTSLQCLFALESALSLLSLKEVFAKWEEKKISSPAKGGWNFFFFSRVFFEVLRNPPPPLAVLGKLGLLPFAFPAGTDLDPRFPKAEGDKTSQE